MKDIFSKPYVIVTFNSTTDAMHAECSFKSACIPGRLVPVPSKIKAGCGMCWYSSIKDTDAITKYMKENKLHFDNVYQRIKD